MRVVESALGVGLYGEVDGLHSADDFLDGRGVGEEFGAAETGLAREDGVIAICMGFVRSDNTG